MRIFFYLLTFGLTCLAKSDGQELVARKVLAIYDSRLEGALVASFVHRICEMPLNYIGLDVIYHDLKEPLPDLSGRPDIRGIITCFPHQMTMENPLAYLAWASDAIDQGKKYVMLYNPGFIKGPHDNYTPDYLINSFYEKLGIYSRNNWHEYTYRYKIVKKDREVVEFEHPYDYPLPPFGTMEIIDGQTHSYLTVQSLDDDQDRAELVIVAPNGGYVAQYYASTFIKEEQAPETRYWYINPFKFFQLAFATEKMPVLDVTTLANRRIYYSQIDGDSWNSISNIEKYSDKRIRCADVVLEEVLNKNPDWPVTVGIIAGDIDPKWVGSEASQAIARKMLALNQVEMGTHTYSHPFDWHFFQAKDQKEKEVKYLYLYPYGSWQSSYLSWLRAAYYLQRGDISTNERNLGYGFVTPRAYANLPFDLENEIVGSARYIEKFAPPDKKVSIIQWTGDCLPWSEPIHLSREQGWRNINGGFTQKDEAYPSYCNVAPIGRHVDGQVQIYASANNENDYTDEWRDRFYGFKYVVRTFENTGLPLRVKPIDLYYHFYSGERAASLNALLSNIEYIKKQEIIPVWTSRYAAAADGFYTGQIYSLGENVWQFKELQGLHTVRIDNPKMHVRFDTSSGVIGERVFQRALYVYLDSAVSDPIVALRDTEDEHAAALVHSRWEIWDVHREGRSIRFKTRGWGNLEMQWRLPHVQEASLHAIDEEGRNYEAVGRNAGGQLLNFLVEAPSNCLLQVEIVSVDQK